MAAELQIDQMTLEEKLRAMEALWEDLCRRAESVPVPQWHKDLLDEPKTPSAPIVATRGHKEPQRIPPPD